MRENYLYKSILFILLLTLAAFPQTVAELQKAIEANKSKLVSPNLKIEERGTLLLEIANFSKQIGNLKFEEKKYSEGTNYFVEAEKFTRNYNQIWLEKSEKDLPDAEQKYADSLKPDSPKGLAEVSLSILDKTLDSIIDYAKQLNDSAKIKQITLRKLELARQTKTFESEAECLETLGSLASDEFNLPMAFENYEKALQIRRTNKLADWRTITSLARLHRQNGDYQTALAKYDEALASLKSTPIDQKAPLKLQLFTGNLAIILLDKNSIFYSLGKYGEVGKNLTELETDQKKLEAIITKIQDPNFRGLSQLLLDAFSVSLSYQRGRLNEVLGNKDAAILTYKQAKTILAKVGSLGGGSSKANILQRLASLLTEPENYAEAFANASEAIRLQTVSQNKRGIVQAILTLCEIEFREKKQAESLRLAREAKAAAEKFNLTDLVATANEFEANSIAETNPNEAIELYKQAVAIYQKQETKPLLIRSLTSLGVAFEKANQPDNAEKSYRRAISIIETIRGEFQNSADNENFSNRKDIIETYRRLVELLTRQNKPEEALKIAVKAQRWSLSDNFNLNEIQLSESSAKIRQSYQSAVFRANSVCAKLKESDSKNLQNECEKAKLKAETEKQNFAAAEKKLRLNVVPLDLANLQKNVAPDEATILYFVSGERLFIFVVRNGKITVRMVEAHRFDLETYVWEIQNEMRSEKVNYDKPISPTFHKNSTSLYEKLISPIEDLLKDVKTLKIVPNDQLFLLPYAALISPTTNRYLVEDIAIDMLTAGDSEREEMKVLSDDVIAFANPPSKLPNLPGATAEVFAIKRIIPTAQIFIRQQASKKALFKIKSAKILHLATHGDVTEQVENSSIIFSNIPRQKNPNLSFSEIYNLPMESSEMVVLSACNSALGRQSGTKFGVFVEAFQTKTNSVVSTLWSVDDEGTKTLMVEFYRNLSLGKTRAESLQMAQLKLLKNPNFRHPFYWAAFVLYGKSGKI